MEQQEKLSKFETAVFSEIDDQVEELRHEAEEAIEQELRKNKEDQLQRSAEEIQKKSQEIRKAYKREVAKFGLEAKRRILQKRAELTDSVFSAVAARLEAFHSSAEYGPYLLGRIKAFSQEYGLADVKILVGEADFALASKIRKAYSLPCEVLCDRSVSLGGFIVRADGDSAFYDETLGQKLAEQKTFFIEKSDLYL